MHEVLVNRLGGLSLPRKSVVRLTDRPDMIFDVYRGRKTTIQQQQQSRKGKRKRKEKKEKERRKLRKAKSKREREREREREEREKKKGKIIQYSMYVLSVCKILKCFRLIGLKM